MPQVNLPKKSETIDTTLSPKQIKKRITLGTNKFDPFLTSKNNKYPFSYKLDENLVYLMAHKHKYWPNIELEFREFIEPRLTVHYVGFKVYAWFYFIMLILAVTTMVGLTTTRQTTGFALTAVIFLSLPLIALYMQRNFRSWLIEKLQD